MRKEVTEDKRSFPYGSFAASVIIHLFIAAAAILIFKLQVSAPPPPPAYVQVITKEIETARAEETPVETEKTPVTENEYQTEKTVQEVKTEPAEVEKYLNFSNANADTSNLKQVYSESTLNVSIRYPFGWTYIDQNVKNKLDGVTFWSADARFDPPPYVHLEVKEKYLFNPRRYSYSMKLKDAVAHYNEPSELQGQVSQEFYIRTETNEDYSIKLIMNGETNFKLFQPEFFGMIKTFRFGKSLF
jgi:hypothetical protein